VRLHGNNGLLLFVGVAQNRRQCRSQTLQGQDQQQHSKHDMFESIVHMAQVYKKTLGNGN